MSVPGRGSFVRDSGGAAAARRAELSGQLSEIARELRQLGMDEEALIALVKGERQDD